MDASLVFSWEQWSQLLLVGIILHLQGRKEQLTDTTLSNPLVLEDGPVTYAPTHTHMRKKSSSLIPRPHGLGMRLGVGSLEMGQAWFENEVGSGNPGNGTDMV